MIEAGDFPQSPFPYGGMDPRHASILGIPEAVFVGCIWNLAFMSSCCGQMDDRLFFQAEKDNIKRLTSINEKEQSKMVKKLSRFGVIEVQDDGPEFFYIKLNLEQLDKMVFK